MNKNYLHDFYLFMSSSKRYRQATINSYCSVLNKYLCYFKKSPKNITKKEVQEYFTTLSKSQTKQTIGSLSIFHKHIAKLPERVKWFKYPKQNKSIPDILNKNEIERLIDSTFNLKHKLIIKLSYDCALRISELINLKISDYDKELKQFHIHDSKGAKDRIVPVNDDTIELLREYYKVYRPTTFILEGQFKGQYSATSIRNVLKDCLVKCKITKKIKFHSLRHSRATHLLNACVSIKMISDFLGHSNTKTTEIYLHTSVEERNNLIREAS